jgi:hypothetical protein
MSRTLAPKDGTTLGLVARGMAIEPLLGGQAVRFDPLALNWIGSTSPEVSVIAVRTDTGVKTLDDVKQRDVVVAGPAPGTDGVTFPTTLNNLLGTRFKVVMGYRSGAEMTLAVERREVEGRGSWSWASFRNDGMAMLKRGELTILVQMATAKSPEIPQVPLVMDYAKTPEQRQILELLLAGQAMAWPVFAPPEVSAERVALLRRAYLAVLKDPETLADAKKPALMSSRAGRGHRHHAGARLCHAAGNRRQGPGPCRPEVVAAQPQRSIEDGVSVADLEQIRVDQGRQARTDPRGPMAFGVTRRGEASDDEVRGCASRRTAGTIL